MGDKYDEHRMKQEINVLVDRDVREIIESFGTENITYRDVLLAYVGKIIDHCIDIEYLEPNPWKLALSWVINTESYIEKFGRHPYGSDAVITSGITQRMIGSMWYYVNKHYRDMINDDAVSKP